HRVAGQVVEVPADRHPLHLRGEHREEAAAQKEREVAPAKDVHGEGAILPVRDGHYFCGRACFSKGGRDYPGGCMTAGVRVKALLRAAELAGGREKLCTLLGVSTRDLDAWLECREATPMEAFLAAVDIVCAVPVERPASDEVERSRGLRRD